MDLRIPFDQAVRDKRMLRNRWDELSAPQQVVLKSIYGCKLDDDEKRIWSAQQGGAEYDDLGYATEITPIGYTPQRYNEAWCIMGRRAGKTDRLASTIVAYEALFGGHEQYLSRGQKGHIFQIAQDLRNAQMALHFIFATLESSPVGLELIEDTPVKDEIRLKNNIIIKCIPCTVKAARGFAVPVAVLDEVGFWSFEADSANQDEEVYRAVRKAQLQFPNKLTVGISSPYAKQGLLWKNYEAGTNGKHAPNHRKREFANVLVVHAPTAATGNPLVVRQSLEEERDRDPQAFERECLALFQDSLSGFLDPKRVREAVQPNVTEISPDLSQFTYVAAIDPAFKHDAFAFTIFHLDEDGMVVQDVVKRWKPVHGETLNPDKIFSEITPYLTNYGIVNIFSDQYHLESLQQLAMRRGFIIEGVPFKANNKAMIYGSLQQLLNQHRIKLLDHTETLRELRQLERKLTGGGTVQIAAPQGAHDDLATVVAICANKCLWLVPQQKEEPKREPTPHERIQEQIQRKRMQEFRGPLTDNGLDW